MLYADDILLIVNDVRVMSSIKIWLLSQFVMKDLGEASYILGIKHAKLQEMITSF